MRATRSGKWQSSTELRGAWDELSADATDRVGGSVAKQRVERSQMQLKRRAWAKKRLKSMNWCWSA